MAASDLSEVRRAERALVQAQRLEAMGLVAGRVAHDFNNLLTVIIGYTELLFRGGDEGTHRLAAKNINKAARRAASLTQQLLGVAGTGRERAAAVDLAAELREMCPVLERLTGGGASVMVHSPDEPVMVAMSPEGAGQTVLNLALNAGQAIEQTRGKLAISLSVVPADRGSPAPGHCRTGSMSPLPTGPSSRWPTTAWG